MVRRTLIVVIAVLGAVPVLSGLLGIVGGPEELPGGGPVNATVDGEYRFVNTFWLAAGLLIWWSLRRPQERAAVTRLILAIASLGAIPRLISAAVAGWPHPVFIGALVLELVVVPLVIWWHVRTFARRREQQAVPSVVQHALAPGSDVGSRSKRMLNDTQYRSRRVGGLS